MTKRARSLLTTALLAAIAYLPLFVTRRGEVAADSKQLLFVDPGRLMARAAYLWDPHVGAGTVTHQNIGYLFPVGPFFWLTDRLGLPMWFAQRLWLGSLLLLAGLGVLFLARRLGWSGTGPVLAAVVYMASPYVAQYASHLSVLLPPFAALPWLLGCAIAAVDEPGWRWPARFALVVALMGGINATAIAYVLVAPAVWLVWAACTRPASVRTAVVTALRLGALTVAVSIWWLSGLLVQSRYGLPLLAYTETLQTVALTSTAPEVLRGAGYWFFYGRDRVGPYLDAAAGNVRRTLAMGSGFLVVIGAFVGAIVSRWRWRAFFVLLLAVGAFIAIGSYPYDSPPPSGRVLRTLSDGSGAGLALRSTNRAVPVVALAIAVLLGAGISALRVRIPRTAVILAVVFGVCALVADTPLWSREMISANRTRPEAIPQYWRDAARTLDAAGTSTRYLELPGQDFASYTWGTTLDPVSATLTERGQLGREVVPYGSAATVDLIDALDRRVQDNTADPKAIAPIAQRLSAGDVLVRYDLQAARYRTPTTADLQGLFEPTPPGLNAPRTYGPANDPALAAYPVVNPAPIVRSLPTAQPVIVAGNGDGLVDAAGVGLLGGPGVVQYAASLTDRPAALTSALNADAILVVTDTNRRREQRFKSLFDNTGYTERAGEQPLRADSSVAALDLFPGRNDDTRSVTVVEGPVAQATSYGNTVTLTPDVRPQLAVDGDAGTWWETGGFGNPVGERLHITLPAAATTDQVGLLQHRSGERGITRARLTFDGGNPVDVTVTPRSFVDPGQTVTFPTRTFRTLDIEILATSGQERNGVGFAEVTIPGVRPATEVVRVPRDLVATAGAASATHPLAFVFTRDRTDARNLARQDPERTLARSFDTATLRSFAVTGTARLDARAADAVVPGVDADVQAAGTVAGDPSERATAALDDDATTAWVNRGPNAWIQVRNAVPITFDQLDLALRNDATHAWPTRVTIQSGGESRVVDVAPPSAADGPIAVRRLSFPALRGSDARLTIDTTSPTRVVNRWSNASEPAPVAVVSYTVPGFTPVVPAGTLPDTCRTDVLTVDGSPVPVRIGGTVEDARRGRALPVTSCSPAVALAPGTHELRSTSASTLGFQIDQIALGSDAGGGAAPANTLAPARPLSGSAAPTLTVTRDTATTATVKVSGATQPFWLVLGESRNDGWTIDTESGARAGAATLVEGYANGWLVTPRASSFTVTLQWSPQRWIWLGLASSAIALIGCCALAFGRTRSMVLTVSPQLDSPLAAPGRRPGALVVAATTIGVFAVTALVAPWWVAAATAGAALAALLVGKLRGVCSVGAIVLLAAAGASIVLEQRRERFQVDFDWPTHFHASHAIACAAITFLLADAAVRAVRRRAARP
ncbi:MAG: alpha-(1-_3)-arabinofuranosyltransferase domain-containing protein [Acidimicrobiia bacterium]